VTRKAKRKRKRNVGSSFDEFLASEDLLDDASVEAIKRVLSWQIRQAMEREDITKSEMARRMRTSRAALERLLNPENSSVTLHTMHRAATVLGKRLQLALVG